MSAHKKYHTDAERKAAKVAATMRNASTPQGRRNRARAHARAMGHNVTPEGRAWLLEQQGGACALPGCDRDATDVDHDHADGCVRGMLCNQCNTGLGKLGDNAAGLTRALQYLPR